MPLSNDDDEELFYILIPQSTGRSSDSLHGLRAYRPYEIRFDGQGKLFSQSFVLLAPQNTSQERSTTKTLTKVLIPRRASSRSNHAKPTKPRKPVSTPTSHELKSEIVIGKDHVDTSSRKAMDNEYIHNYDDSGSIESIDRSNTRSSPEAETIRTASSKRKVIEENVQNKPAPRQTQIGEKPPISQTRRSTRKSQSTSTPLLNAKKILAPISRKLSTKDYTTSSNGNSPSITSGTPIMSKLTKEQSVCVHLIWFIKVNEDEWQFHHTLNECDTFSKFIDLIHEDAKGNAEATMALKKTKIWQLSYQLPGLTRKVLVARTGTKLALECLKTTLAQSTVWSENEDIKIDVEIKALG